MTLTPIRREVIVAADPDHAFRVFTEQIGAWWPLAQLSVHGAEASVSFETDGRLVERTGGGEEAVWGTVTHWEPGSQLRFTWHPGGEPAQASHVTVRFTPDGDHTRVTLEHAGWEVFVDPAATRAEYDHGWPMVLDLYRDHFETDTEATWVALVHTPTATVEGSVFEDPRFAEHVAFLQRMEQRGYLVAAGPLGDAPGAGMTILRLPGEDRIDEATRLATQDDQAVVGGLFDVAVRPWQVMFHSLD